MISRPSKRASRGSSRSRRHPFEFESISAARHRWVQYGVHEPADPGRPVRRPSPGSRRVHRGDSRLQRLPRSAHYGAINKPFNFVKIQIPKNSPEDVQAYTPAHSSRQKCRPRVDGFATVGAKFQSQEIERNQRNKQDYEQHCVKHENAHYSALVCGDKVNMQVSGGEEHVQTTRWGGAEVLVGR
jgi:hypothetical protein